MKNPLPFRSTIITITVSNCQIHGSILMMIFARSNFLFLHFKYSSSNDSVLSDEVERFVWNLCGRRMQISLSKTGKRINMSKEKAVDFLRKNFNLSISDAKQCFYRIKLIKTIPVHFYEISDADVMLFFGYS